MTGGSESDDEFSVDASIPSTPFEEDAGPAECFEPSAANVDANEGIAPGLQEESNGDTAAEQEDTEEQEDTQEQEDTDDRQCRICFGGAEEEDVLGRLISPCLCTGSVRVSSRE
jgi:hypothetical protein